MAADLNTILGILVGLRFLKDEVMSLAKQQGYTEADLDIKDTNRAAEIDEFKRAAGIE